MSTRNAILVLLGLAALFGSAAAARFPISMVDSRFVPDTAVVTRGDTVVWTNSGSLPHTSTSGVNGVYDSLWDSGTMSHGDTFMHAFSTAGDYPYFCRFHFPSGMKGVLRVNSGAIEEGLQADLLYNLAVVPRPFQSEASISYQTGDCNPVRLRIVDMSGRTVRTLVSDRCSAGRHVATWDGIDDRGQPVAAGVYFCRLTSNAQAAHVAIVKTGQ